MLIFYLQCKVQHGVHFHNWDWKSSFHIKLLISLVLLCSDYLQFPNNYCNSVQKQIPEKNRGILILGDLYSGMDRCGNIQVFVKLWTLKGYRLHSWKLTSSRVSVGTLWKLNDEFKFFTFMKASHLWELYYKKYETESGRQPLLLKAVCKEQPQLYCERLILQAALTGLREKKIKSYSTQAYKNSSQ